MKTKLENGQKLDRQYRNVSLSADNLRAVVADGESRIVRNVSVSSDEPYDRWYGTEILKHEAENVDLERVTSGAAPLLYNHDRDAFAGKILNPVLRDGKLYVDFKFSQNEQATQMLADLRDGLLTECSIGYDVSRFEVDEDEETYTATRWILYEVSLVTIPADFTVGVGRTKPEGQEVEILKAGENSQTREKNVDTLKDETHKRETTTTMADEKTPQQIEQERKQRERDEADATRERNEKIQEGIKAARERETEIRAIADRATIPDDKKGEFERALNGAIEKAVTDEKAVSDFQTYVFKNFVCGQAKVLDTPSGNGSGDLKPNAKKSASLGTIFVESESFKRGVAKRAQGERVASVDIDYPILGIRGKVAMAQRAGFTSSDLAPINVQIQTQVIGLGVQRLTIMDLIAPGSTGAAAIIYPRENSFGSVDGVAVASGAMPRAKGVGERGVKPLWEPDLTTETANVKKIAITTKVPDEFMADFPAARSFIDERLPFMVDTETEYQLLYGDGLGNNLKGIFSTLGVQTRAITTTDDSTKAASLLQGLTDIRVQSFFEPDGYAFHPYDWETAKLLKDSTGRFLAGGPYYIPYTNGVFMELNTFWGKPVVVSTAVTYRRPLAGCWKLGAQYFLREGMRLEMTNANEDDFRRNLIMLRAEHRLALAVYRPIAFIEFTGFPARN